MSVSKEIKFFLINSVLKSLIYFLLNLYAKTMRVRVENAEKVLSHAANGGRVIVGTWHQRFFGGLFIPRMFQVTPCIMISQSRDGDFASKIARNIGWKPVRGSSSRGGKQALRAMVEGVMKNPIGFHIVDGPNGPPRIIKPGLIALARDADAVITLGLISYEKAWIANSWDQFMVPKPFSRILIRAGSTFPVPEKMNDDEFEAFRKKVEDALAREMEAADNSWKK
ncbi:MAG: hypothetical protein H6Q49_328 [Deltaproteobacteria bacterium]|nr:hypothetical protein [Deltaproteobacteria bacterium]